MRISITFPGSLLILYALDFKLIQKIRRKKLIILDYHGIEIGFPLQLFYVLIFIYVSNR